MHFSKTLHNLIRLSVCLGAIFVLSPRPANADIILEAGPYLAQPAGLTKETIFKTSYGVLAGGGLGLVGPLSGHLAFRYYSPSTQLSMDASLWDASATLRLTLPLGVFSAIGEAGYMFRYQSTTLPSAAEVTDVLHGTVLGAGVQFSVLPLVSVGPHLEYLTSFGDLFERGWFNASVRLMLSI